MELGQFVVWKSWGEKSVSLGYIVKLTEKTVKIKNEKWTHPDTRQRKDVIFCGSKEHAIRFMDAWEDYKYEYYQRTKDAEHWFQEKTKILIGMHALTTTDV